MKAKLTYSCDKIRDSCYKLGKKILAKHRIVSYMLVFRSSSKLFPIIVEVKKKTLYYLLCQTRLRANNN